MKTLLFALLFTTQAFAATSGTLLLKGAVPAVLELIVTPTPLATTLPLNTTQNQAHVADLTVRWNTVAGARISVSSANAGQLRHTTVTSSVIAYTLHSPDVGTFSVATPQSYDAAVAGPQDITRAININYTGVPYDQLVEGDYTDTLTFTISAL